MGGQGNKLVEPCPPKVVAQGILFLLWTEVDVAHNQRVLLRVNEVFQEVGCTGEGLVLGSVDGDDVQLSHDNFAQLHVGRSQVVDSLYLQPFSDIHCQPFSMTLTEKVTLISLQLKATFSFFNSFQPCLLET